MPHYVGMGCKKLLILQQTARKCQISDHPIALKPLHRYVSQTVQHLSHNGKRTKSHRIQVDKNETSYWLLGVQHKQAIISWSCSFIWYSRVQTCGSVAEWLGCWTCDQQVAGSNPGLSTVECNPGQVVNTHVPVTKQYNLVPANGR